MVFNWKELSVHGTLIIFWFAIYTRGGRTHNFSVSYHTLFVILISPHTFSNFFKSTNVYSPNSTNKKADVFPITSRFSFYNLSLILRVGLSV
jgi:hypothetical protein